MRKIVACMLFALQFFLVSYAQAETISYYGGIDRENEGYISFCNSHPDITFDQIQDYYQTTSQLFGKMLTKEFQCDLLNLDTKNHDFSRLMTHESFVDLSSSSVIADAIARMHPAIAKNGMADGKIYAVPNGVRFEYLRIYENAWFDSGLTMEDIPQSFPDFLTFLENWCERLERGEVDGVRVFSGFDIFYSEISYIRTLTSLLVDHYMMQSQFAGQTLDFDNNEFIALLERCKAVGKLLYEYEPPIDQVRGPGAPLFTQDAQMVWPQTAKWIVFLRLNDEQPKLIKAWLNMYAVYADSKNKERTIELLEKIVTGPESPMLWNDVLLYQDSMPKINNNYEHTKQANTSRIKEVEAQLQRNDLTPEARISLEDDLKLWQHNLENNEKDSNKYHVSASELEDYRAYVGSLYFAGPNAFENAPTGVDVLQTLEQQFAYEKLTTETFVTELNRIARMMELENQ